MSEQNTYAPSAREEQSQRSLLNNNAQMIIKTEDDLVKYFAPKVKKYAQFLGRKIGAPPEDMEQELYIVLLRAHKLYGDYDANFERYFTRSVRNFFINLLNERRRSDKTISLDQFEEPYEIEVTDIELEAQALFGMTLEQLIVLPKKQLKRLRIELCNKGKITDDLMLKIVTEFLQGKTYTQLAKEYSCKGLTNPRSIRYWTKLLIKRGIISEEQLEERMSMSKKSRARHTDEQKRAIVMEYLTTPASAREVATKYQINPSQIFLWKKRLGIEQEKVRKPDSPPEEDA